MTLSLRVLIDIKSLLRDLQNSFTDKYDSINIMRVLNIYTFNEEYISLTDIIKTKTCLITKRGASFDDMLNHTWARFHKTDSFDGLGSCKTADVCSVKRFANKQSLLKCYGARMSKFSMNPYFIFKRFECYATLIVKELLYNKNQIFLLLFQKVL